jgi:hypothetical protein
MKVLTAAVLAFSLSVPAAMAADATAPLAAGKPAGVKQAQMGNSGWLILGGIGIAAAGIALAASGGNGGSITPAPATTTTTTTS